MKSRIQAKPSKMIKKARHGYTRSIDSTKYSTSVLDEFKELKTERGDIYTNKCQNFNSSTFSNNKASTEQLEQIIQEVQTIDERAHHERKQIMNQHFDREFQTMAMMKELKFQKFLQEKKDKQSKQHIEELKRIIMRKEEEHLSQIQMYQSQLKMMQEGKRYQASGEKKRSSLNKSLKQTNNKKIHKNLQPYEAYCNTMRKKRSKRSNKTNSAASSPRSSAFSVTPFEEQNVPPSSSAMTTPKKSGKKRYESSEYSDYLMTTKSASKRATKFSYNTKMKKSGKRRKSGKCASFVCNAMDSSNPSFLKTPDKVEVPRNPEAKDERGSKADMNFATPISFSHPPTEEQLVQGDSWDQREKMHLTKSLKKENGDPVSAIQFSTYDTSKDAYSSKVIPKRSSNTNSRKSKSIKSMVTSQASENIGVDVDIEIIDDSDFQNSSEDSLYDPNKERAQDFTEMWTQNVKDEDQRKLLNKTMRTIAEVSDENISSKDHSNLIKSKNSKPSFHLNSVNLSQSQLDINKPYPYTRKVKLIQHCQKAHDEQFSSQNSYSKYSSGLSQEKRIFSGFKEFTDNIRSSNQESICDTEERYCETNEDYNPLNDTGNLTMTERGPIMLSRETDKHIPREIDLTNSNEHFLGSSCTEGVSSPSQAMPVVILRAESE